MPWGAERPTHHRLQAGLDIRSLHHVCDRAQGRVEAIEDCMLEAEFLTDYCAATPQGFISEWQGAVLARTGNGHETRFFDPLTLPSPGGRGDLAETIDGRRR